MMKFIHLADAHLDSPFRGLSFLPSTAFRQIKNASEQSFSQIVDTALENKVDLVLIAGDTFDSTHPSPNSQLFFKDQIKRLTDNKIQVVMIFGNHDHLPQSELLVEPSAYFHLLGADQKVEKVSYTTKNGFNYDVVGFSYFNNHITEDMLASFPAKSSSYTFGLMHAQEKASSKSQNVYAPFSLKNMRELNYDYFALGHIHLRQTLSEHPLIAYSGNIQGRHINELGQKGCLLGEIDEKSHETKIHFVKTAPILWKKVEISLTNPLSKGELTQKMLALGQIEETSYFSLVIKGAENLTIEQIELINDHDFWENLATSLPLNSRIVDVRLKLSQEKLVLNQADQIAFDQAFQELFQTSEFQKIARFWAKKNNLAGQMVTSPTFINEVAAQAKLKLAQKLKGFNDETETN